MCHRQSSETVVGLTDPLPQGDIEEAADLMAQRGVRERHGQVALRRRAVSSLLAATRRLSSLKFGQERAKDEVWE